MDRRIRKLAKITRNELQDFVESDSTPFYNDWSCSCLVCSWLLNKVFKAHGIDSILCIGEWDKMSHAFVMIEDSVIDITATQFGLPAIYIKKFNGSKYTIEHVGREARLDIRYWPWEQRPRTYRYKLEKIYKQILEKTK